MKKTTIIASLLIVLSLFSVVTPVEAGIFDNVLKRVENRVENRQENKEERREKNGSRAAEIRLKAGARVAIGNGKLTAINDTTLTVEKDGKTYTVLTGVFDKCTTVFKRRFWGSASLSEYAVGNMVNVTGRFQGEEKTTIQACVIRNISIQKRYGVFIGEVISLLGNGWTMTTVSNKRDNQTVTVSSNTKFTNRKEETIVQGDVKVGHKVMVKGLWDRSNNTITEVRVVKDFSLPLRATVTATVTPTATPTP